MGRQGALSDKATVGKGFGVSQSYSRYGDGEVAESGTKVHKAHGTEDEKDKEG